MKQNQLKKGDIVKFYMSGEIVRIKRDKALVVSGDVTYNMPIDDLEPDDINGNDSIAKE